MTLAFYAIPALGQLARAQWVRVYSLWFGGFLVIQAIATLLVVDRDFVTLQPGLDSQIDVVGGGLPGIQGLQSITTDSMGFRVTKEIDYRQKPDGTYRVFAIGGSTTEQILLDDRRTWTHLLQKHLVAASVGNDVEVINTGVSGLRSRQHLATLKEISAFSPDLVIFLMGINDWNRHIWSEHGEPEQLVPVPKPYQFSESLLGMLLRGVQGMLLPPAELGAITEKGEYYTNQNDSLRRADRRSFEPAQVSAEYRDAAQEIVAHCGSQEFQCLFVTQPTGYRQDAPEDLKRHFWMTPPNTVYTLDLPSMVTIAGTYNRFLLKLAADNGHPSCDLASQIESSLNYFYDDCHFNQQGAREVAMQLHRCVISAQ